MEHHHILILVVSLLLLVNLGLNIALLLKKKNVNENYKRLASIPIKNTSSITSKPEYVAVAELTMPQETINFSFTPQQISGYQGAILKLDGLSNPIGLRITNNRVELFNTQTGAGLGGGPISSTLLIDPRGYANNFILNYTNNNGSINIELIRDRNIVYKSTVGNAVSPVILSFGSSQITKWTMN